ncbi:VOC family protein [Nocardia mangyaensis]|uniref:VOC family protein n=1 Tax=Nocardia mangyaensis TaxID=2213200 RepID=UPI002676518D|nr:VOC family protein [Nocardia mangyaensis]MDO3649017.1 VOC family protein [Nocardia mangyaensis]
MIRWTWAFLDRPATTFDACVRFWATVTGSTVSAPRGAHDEFVTLLPSRGPAWLKMQRVGDDGGVHLDLDVDDLPAAVTVATGLGARVVAHGGDYTVLESPAGQTFCFTQADTASITDPTTPLVTVSSAPDGTVSRLDQICLDLSPTDLATDTTFWRELTGWAPEPVRRPEFSRLRGPGHPVQLLIQRLDDHLPASAHPDLSSTDLAATAAWHTALGATRVTDTPHWIVLRDPGGVHYCVTARDPYTGRVP